MEAWKKYAEESFSEAFLHVHIAPEFMYIPPLDGNIAPGKPSKSGKVPSTVQLEIDEDGFPVLPDTNPTSRKDMAATLRQLLTAYYRELTSIPILSDP
jgi:hypothetical protein